MPIFEYECQTCNWKFEQLVPKADTPVRCVLCGSDKVVKQFSVFGTTSTSKNQPACPQQKSCAEAGGCCCNGGCHHHK